MHACHSNIKASFGSRNKLLEWNGYSYEIVILLFGSGLFLKIGISIGIHIPLRRGIPIPLKNERNSYSLGQMQYF
jgi:hypothetical protein